MPLPNSRFLVTALLVASGLIVGNRIVAQEPPSDQGFQQLAAYRLESHLADKTVSLAKAIPAEDYDWRPEEGVRSLAEVFSHVGSSYVWFGVQLGAEKHADLPNWGDLEGKDEIVAALEQSMEFARDAVLALSDEDLVQPVEFFGRQTILQELVLNLMTHGSEHLGQAIAYARSVGVTPPWSE